MKRRKRRSKTWFILMLVFLVVLAGGATAFFVQSHRKKDAAEVYEQMAEDVNDVRPEEPEEEPVEEPAVPIPEKNLDWDALHKENEDIYAWIYVPDAGVDYPVVQHPTDNTYYLEHNLDGSEGFPGCIYTEDYNRKDFTDPHTVIYGHNMDNDTMFSRLHNFSDPERFAGDHYIFIYTEDAAYAYQVFAAYEYGAIHLLDNFDLDNEYVYEQYLKDVMSVDNTPARVANVRHDIEVTKEDRIVTLSTCTTDHDASLRYLVAGVLVEEQPDGQQ